MTRLTLASLAFLGCLWSVVSAQTDRVPEIWNDAALAEWATPVAGLNVRPGHYSSKEYYAIPGDNLRTYPVYHPDREPAGYWEHLQSLKPEPLVDPSKMRATADWVAAGARAFEELDSVFLRTGAQAVIAQARDPRTFEGAYQAPDGTAFGLRWVVTPQGVMLTTPACVGCHRPPRTTARVTPALRGLPVVGVQATLQRLLSTYQGDEIATAFWRDYTVPWAPDERVEQMRTMSIVGLQQLAGPNGLGRSFRGGVFARTNGSPFYVTKIPNLENLKYSRYLDATGTHRLRGPEDVARYAALVSGADSLDFGEHHLLTDAQRHIRLRYADEVLYSIGEYLMSAEPPKNPDVAPAGALRRGEAVFRREGCVTCHVPPAYTSGKLTLAEGWTPPEGHPNRGDILPVSVGTDPGAALKTRKGTGMYKIPSLRGVWQRQRLLHDGSMTSLEDMFDAARLSPDYEPKGWSPPGVSQRAVTGHTFGLTLTPEDKAALLAFLRSL